jgi:hypothetical protein
VSFSVSNDLNFPVAKRAKWDVRGGNIGLKRTIATFHHSITPTLRTQALLVTNVLNDLNVLNLLNCFQLAIARPIER